MLKWEGVLVDSVGATLGVLVFLGLQSRDVPRARTGTLVSYWSAWASARSWARRAASRVQAGERVRRPRRRACVRDQSYETAARPTAAPGEHRLEHALRASSARSIAPGWQALQYA